MNSCNHATQPAPVQRQPATCDNIMTHTSLAQPAHTAPSAVALCCGVHAHGAMLLLLPTQCNTVQWYPGHIAKAERQLKEQLKMVDLVLEVRDARIPISTCHPQVCCAVGVLCSVLFMFMATASYRNTTAILCAGQPQNRRLTIWQPLYAEAAASSHSPSVLWCVWCCTQTLLQQLLTPGSVVKLQYNHLLCHCCCCQCCNQFHHKHNAIGAKVDWLQAPPGSHEPHRHGQQGRQGRMGHTLHSSSSTGGSTACSSTETSSSESSCQRTSSCSGSCWKYTTAAAAAAVTATGAAGAAGGVAAACDDARSAVDRRQDR